MRFFFSPSAPVAAGFEVFFAALAPSVGLAGALEAVEAGAFPAVEAGLGAIAIDCQRFGRAVYVVDGAIKNVEHFDHEVEIYKYRRVNLSVFVLARSFGRIC